MSYRRTGSSSEGKCVSITWDDPVCMCAYLFPHFLLCPGLLKVQCGDSRGALAVKVFPNSIVISLIPSPALLITG